MAELILNRLKFFVGVDAQIPPFGKILVEHTVGILIGVALPR